MHAYRSHTCGALRSTDAGANVRLSGWIHRKRDHGGLLFIDLRDHYGLTQLVLHPETPGFDVVERLRAESVIKIDGEVVLREGSTVNANLPTGEVEVRVQSVEVLSEAAELPLPVFGEPEYPEEIRLKNRFLDLRRETLHRNIVLRSRVIQSIRNRMCAQGFLEYQTPILTASSPEGARDFLVPSRMHPGKFYALPQAPQQFKQLLMVGGFDRYFQIASCFRDEDPRSDRSPGEFTQLDVEMAFVEQDDVFDTMEQLMYPLYSTFSGWSVTPPPFPRIPYAEAMQRYGTDKPDLRFDLDIRDVSPLFAESDFQMFRSVVARGGVVRMLRAPGVSDRPRRFFDTLQAFAQEHGAKGLAYLVATSDGVKGPIAGGLEKTLTTKLLSLAKADTGDALLFIADEAAPAADITGRLRLRLA
ncbi:MAG: aspartate--tRNA ligase, partial [Proteobacteria bacterium]|nr:aspartate--tRNA ligase [Pseudomonadota bacterium]